jgi:transaldolase
MTTNGAASNDSPLARLSQLGQSVWVDFISRQALEDGDIERLIREDSVTGLTSNPTIFQKAIAEGHAYDDQLREVLEREEDGKEVFLALAERDIEDACELLRPIYDRTGCRDGWVSMEVDPTLAYEADATLAEAKRLREMIDHPNLLVKIPGTEPGLRAIEEAIAAGIPVNVTLLFSLSRYSEVCDAYIRGIERLIESGGDPRGVESVASFFVSLVDKRLGEDSPLAGKAAIANARLAYQIYLDKFDGDQWQKLADQGASTQRCLWASTSVKNPNYKDTMYVEELIGPDTVNTMPLETIEAFQDHGEPRLSLTEDIAGARRVFDQLTDHGIDMEEVGRELEKEGVEKFADSYRDLLEDVKKKRDALARA